MPSENEITIAQKALAYDIIRMLEKNEKNSYPVKEIINLINKIIDACEQAP